MCMKSKCRQIQQICKAAFFKKKNSFKCVSATLLPFVFYWSFVPQSLDTPKLSEGKIIPGAKDEH